MFAHSLGSVMCYDLMYETCIINGLLETKERDSSPMDVDLTGGEREREREGERERRKSVTNLERKERERERGKVVIDGSWSWRIIKITSCPFPQIIHLKTRLMKSLKSYRS